MLSIKKNQKKLFPGEMKLGCMNNLLPILNRSLMKYNFNEPMSRWDGKGVSIILQNRAYQIVQSMQTALLVRWHCYAKM